MNFDRSLWPSVILNYVKFNSSDAFFNFVESIKPESTSKLFEAIKDPQVFEVIEVGNKFIFICNLFV